MVAGGESKGLSSHRKPVDGEGAEAEFKYITKILARESGIYVFDYDTLRLFTPADAVRQRVQLCKTLLLDVPTFHVTVKGSAAAFDRTVNGFRKN